VLACRYVARLYGVRSAMPVFKVLAMCPDAVVIRPDMAKYQEVGQEVRALMRRLTPLVEPLSIDEAFLDLSGTEVLHGSCPAQLLSALAKDIETTLGITVSIGLSDNKFLAKIASDLDKPRGFAILSRSEAHVFFADKPVSLLWGVGAANNLNRATHRARRSRTRDPLQSDRSADRSPRSWRGRPCGPRTFQVAKHFGGNHLGA
jgi:DNA polymerase IV